MNLDAIPVGPNPPWDLNVVIEIPQGGLPVKYEMDKASGALFVDRFLHTAMYYPGNYGFVPHTLADDGDPGDVIVLNPTPDARTLTGNWTRYANGQTITSAYKPATLVNPNVAPITVRFDSTTTGVMTLPGGNTIPITRFRF